MRERMTPMEEATTKVGQTTTLLVIRRRMLAMRSRSCQIIQRASLQLP